MDKLGRNYKMFIQTNTGTRDAGGFFTSEDNLFVTPPITMEFDIDRNFLGTRSNTANFRIYNLSQLNRNDVRFDDDNYGDFRLLTLQAGYGDNLSTIYQGNITRSNSIREGVNFITSIDCEDAGFNYINSHFSGNIPAGTSDANLYQTLIESMPNISVGAIGDFPNKNLRTNSYSAPTIDILHQNSNGCFFIDKQKAHVLNPDEYISNGDILVIAPETGLLGTPELSNTILHFNIIFEPRIDVGSLILLQSQTDKKYNKYWKVNRVKHRGMISDSVCGEAITTVSCNYTPKPRPVQSQ